MATSAAPSGANWTPQLVEDLVARQFLHNQDISGMKPPAPLAARNVNQQQSSSSAAAGMKGGNSAIVPFSDATKQYMKFFNQQNVAPTAGGASSSVPPPASSAVTPAMMSPSTTGAKTNTTTSPSSRGLQQQQLSPQSKTQQQQPQQMFPTASSSSVPPSPSSHHQLQQLQQIQQQLSAVQQQQQQQQQQAPTATNTLAAMGGLQQQQQMLLQRQTDCVASCKQIATTKVQFPAHIPSNNQLMARPDPNDPKKSLCPSATLMMQRIMAQQHIDADLIFSQPREEFPLNKIFAQYPDAMKVIANARGESGDWRSDTFSREEEATYKKAMGYNVFGPYQARSNSFGEPL